jgi:hypothetical protein
VGSSEHGQFRMVKTKCKSVACNVPGQHTIHCNAIAIRAVDSSKHWISHRCNG